MMDSKNLIINSIDNFISELNTMKIEVKFRYEQLLNLNTNLVEILPLEKFDSDLMIDFRFDLQNIFNESFPNEDLVFVSENSLNKISNPIYCNESVCANNFQYVYFDDLKEFKPVDMYFGFDNSEICSSNISFTNFLKNEIHAKSEINNSEIIINNKNNYALAA